MNERRSAYIAALKAADAHDFGCSASSVKLPRQARAKIVTSLCSFFAEKRQGAAGPSFMQISGQKRRFNWGTTAVACSFHADRKYGYA